MAVELNLEKYRPLLKQARDGFLNDPIYAVAIVEKAGTLLSRKEVRQQKQEKE